ncbi:phosphotransferase family protein [Nocardiopsis ganjiahuensis]|uniref:phosphotransferase family protein n=1 Tax=Nocardiopsis ganjiahuensis TaxID=239984 RepID=UPI0004776002|nr:phosphotransferase [Nocardiopsis ganjiahuensis]
MSTIRGFAHLAPLQDLARQAFGSRVSVVGVERLRGGTKKGVYRLELDQGSSVVAYVWSGAENYWPDPAPGEDGTDPFAHADGVDLFVGAARVLESLGVRSPRVYLVERDHRGLAGDAALVEDVRGPTLEEHIARSDPAWVGGVLERLGQALTAMAAPTHQGLGKVSRPLVRGRSCESLVLERALNDVEEGARRRPELARVAPRLGEHLRALAERVRPRSGHGVIHGELGPDHVLVDGEGVPVLIDIEGLMYFDAEWEHTFLRLRFAGLYEQHLARPGLDPARMDLYTLAQHLSLVAGPLRLLEGDYPDREEMLAIAEHHLGRVLAHL